MQNSLRSTLAALTRCYPLMKGGGKLANLPPMRRLSAKPEVVDAQLRGGGVLRVPINDYVGRPIYWTGDFDRRVSWALRRILRPGDAVLDIGANLGVYAIQAARLVGPTGVVHAVEPQREVADLLERSVALNGLANTTVHRVGLSDHDGEAKLGYREDDTGGRGIVPDDSPRNTLSIEVREASGFLSGLWTEAGSDVCPTLPGFRLMKLDVEGHEPQVLSAARPWLAEHPPDCVLFESHAEGGPFLDRPEVRTLVSLGYRFAALQAGWLGVEPVPVRTSDDAARCNAIDYLAVHETAAEQDATLTRMLGTS
jgi:FkbM family methyltransferase